MKHNHLLCETLCCLLLLLLESLRLPYEYRLAVCRLATEIWYKHSVRMHSYSSLGIASSTEHGGILDAAAARLEGLEL